MTTWVTARGIALAVGVLTPAAPATSRSVTRRRGAVGCRFVEGASGTEAR
jgi:hypothetical protein